MDYSCLTEFLKLYLMVEKNGIFLVGFSVYRDVIYETTARGKDKEI